MLSNLLNTVAKAAAAILLISSVSAAGIAVMGDAGRAGSELNALKKSVMTENVTSILMPGDNLYKGSYESVWDNWKQSGLRFDITAIGNHTDGYAQEVKYFDMPAEYYSKVKDGARFIVLNSDNTNTVSEQFAWLNQEMNRVSEKLIFLVYHHPTYSVSDSHSWTEKKEFQLQMREFLKKNSTRITALLLGHDHMSQFLMFGSVHVVIAGAGREVRNEGPVSFSENSIKIETKYLAPRQPHWGLLEIASGAAEATITFVRVMDQKRSCTARFRNSEMLLEGECRQ